MSGLIGTPALRASRAPPSPPACSANVVSSSVVQWNGTALPTTYVSGTQVQATVLVITTLVVLINIMVDLSYYLLDPRIQQHG